MHAPKGRGEEEEAVKTVRKNMIRRATVHTTLVSQCESDFTFDQWWKGDSKTCWKVLTF